MRVYLHALGCKLNQSEIVALARTFHALGHIIVDKAREADWCIVNTCTVTHIAARKSRQLIRRLRRENPNTHIAVTGCYAEISPQELEALNGVDLIVGNADKERLPKILEEMFPLLERSVSPSRPWRPSRTRAFVKIQDGCDNRCTYCVVTLARGPQRSRSADQILAEISQRVAEGYKEIVLTGVHIGAYGRDLRPTTNAALGHSSSGLRDLIERILAQTDTQRLRLSSIEPWDFDESLLTLWQNPRLCRHLHLPLQSGCDATLRRMGRHYSVEEYVRKVLLAREAIPDVAITTDIIVGFPGETEAEFATTMNFVQSIGFARIHVFKYSPRPGTPAAKMPDQVSPQVKEDRCRAMHILAQRAQSAFTKRFFGRTFPVLWETRSRGFQWKGLTDHYVRVYTTTEKDLHNTIAEARLLNTYGDGAWAAIV